MVVVGKRLVWDGEHLFCMLAQKRRQHIYVLGKTGTGKSSLIRNVLIQGLHAGRGVGLIDSHSDLAAGILEHILLSRTADIVYFSPANLDHPVGLNLFPTLMAVIGRVRDRHRRQA